MAVAAAAQWWAEIRRKGPESYASGMTFELPEAGVRSIAFSNEVLFVREAFDGLYKEILTVLESRKFGLCHVNGNSGVGKSAFLWYFIIRTGIDRPESVILYETDTRLWEFRRGALRLVAKTEYSFDEIESSEVTFHLIDQKISPGRPIGNRAVVAASPDDDNTKSIRKVRRTYTRYLPPWDKTEFDLLVKLWKSQADKLPGPEADEVDEKVKAANLAFSWFGGIPRFLWDREDGTLTEEDFRSDVMKCLANTKLKNVSVILQNSAGVSWRLFHFNVTPGTRFRRFRYTFCSEKVASLYAEYLCTTNVDKIRSFLEASQPFSEYSALRGFVFEQYVVSQALEHDIMVMPMVDTAYCQHCSRSDDRGKNKKVPWIQCGTCLKWYHTKCVGIKFKFDFNYKCRNCQGEPNAQVVSPSGLLLRYYEGDLEDALLAAGEEAIKYLWRPLKKNNAVFDFVLLPRTLGQATVARTNHRPVLEATIKAQQALKAWRDEFYQDNNNDDTLLAFFVPPDSYSNFKFQPYRSSGKVAQKAVKGIVQCKVAVPVSGSPYVAKVAPNDMDAVSLDPNLPETWEEALGCIECSEDIVEQPEKSLEQEKVRYCRQNLAFDGDELDALEAICNLADGRQKRKRLQALCKMYKIAANTTNQEMLACLEAERERLDDMEVD
ncbi:uncharacterized protein LOC112341278 [Selaginella moellendorffii]|uniref:uncharacterized protein LOC112341278 n=1 Tax=Selaginella moellendorffii TaxID=88036 RepID=UPI000D1C8A35|nr:uncharacterized protein LOC112341278 [Selaginella moellendorffii]|eukprot:XP_024516943.1 uncharacterized protein LOC112341278 [Selaginella moellendorffii]